MKAEDAKAYATDAPKSASQGVDSDLTGQLF